MHALMHAHTRTHPFNGPISRTTRVSRYQEGKTNLDFTEARDSEWHQLGRMQVCISLPTDNHASTPPLSFLQAGCPSCRPTNSFKALKALLSIKCFTMSGRHTHTHAEIAIYAAATADHRKNTNGRHYRRSVCGDFLDRVIHG